MKGDNDDDDEPSPRPQSAQDGNYKKNLQVFCVCTVNAIVPNLT